MIQSILKIADLVSPYIPSPIRKIVEFFIPKYAFVNFYVNIKKDLNQKYKVKERIQFLRLKKILSFVYEEVPYYRKLFKEINFSLKQFQSIEDIKKITILTKEIVRKQPQSFIRTRSKRNRLIDLYTSGSTGTPLKVFFDKREIYFQAAVLQLQYSLAGVNLRDKHILINRVLKKNLLYEQIGNCLFINPLKLAQEEYCSKIVSFLAKNSDYKFIRGYPSSIRLLAEYLNRNKIRIKPPKAIIIGYEYCDDDTKLFIENTFQSPVFNYYALNEGVVYGVECRYHKGIHLLTNISIVELIATGTDKYKIVATPLYNYTMPLIRYDTEDFVANYIKENCLCGYEGITVPKIIGRQAQLIKLDNGDIYDFQQLSRVVRGIFWIKESRFVYYPKNKLIILEIIPDINLNHTGMKIIRKRMSGLFSGLLKWEIRIVKNLSRTYNGKFQFVNVKTE